jgi:D-alanyl-D-alanine carboxypeptidase/D-alanyl-D-alanine-endopeptidase (penicillin-binding protein 4)
MAPTGAASLNSNAVAVYLRPDDHPSPKATVEVEPPSDYFVIDALVATGARRNRRYSVLSESMGERQKIIARGFVPAGKETWSAWRKIDNPLQYFGQTLKTVLGERGIKVKGRVRAGPVPNTARELYSAESDTLDVVLKRLNKHSSNFIAEQLLKTLGAEVAGGPGSSARGVGVVEDFLEKDVGIPRGSYAMKNGSGLNDANRFSAAQLSRLLRYMWERFPLAPEYLGSLGIAGKDGTVKYRFEGSDAVGRLRAKTGTLENVSALSGYVQSVGGEKLAFSMICNDYPGRAGPVVQGLDAMGAALAASGSSQGPDRAVAQWMTPPIVVGSLDDLKGRVKTYLAMAKPSDPRNQAFLRTAWRTERDPAVRAVVANALYVSDPQDYVAQRTLLDSFLATQDVFGRLQKVAEQLGVEVPGVASILDLAAEGNPDALTRAVELSYAGKGDGVRKEIDQGLAEVARAAADELLAALRHASPSEREAALSGLARGLVLEADPDQPFWPALKKELGAPDPESAGFAREVESTLSLKIAAEKAPKAAVAVPPPPASPPSSGAPPETRPGG